MLIIKKILILTQVEDSGVSGVVRMENFGGCTSCDIKLTGVDDDWWLGVFVEDDLIVCTNKQGKVYAERQADLSKPIVCLVMRGDKVESVGCVNHATCQKATMKNQIKEYQSWYKQECKLASMQKEKSQQDSQKVDTYPPNIQDDKQKSVAYEQVENEQVSTDEEWVAVEDNDKASTDEVADNEQILPFDMLELADKRQDSITQNVDDMAMPKVKQQKQEKKSSKPSEFFDSIKMQIDKLFTDYERDSQLEELVSGSKWVRVPTDDSYYVVGVISDNDEPQLLCYGVPDEDNTNPPKCDKSCRQWLEVGENKGYWMMYQCAKTGKMLQDDQVVK